MNEDKIAFIKKEKKIGIEDFIVTHMLIPGINGAHKHLHHLIQTLTLPLVHIGIKYTLLNTHTHTQKVRAWQGKPILPQWLFHRLS